MTRQENDSLVLRPFPVARIFALIAVALVAASVGFSLLDKILRIESVERLSDAFRLNKEENVPAFYSGALMLIDAGLLALVWWSQRSAATRIRAAWLGLSLIFVFLSFDELFSVHERLIEPLRDTLNTSGLLYFAWIIVYGLAVVVIASAFLPVWLRLDSRLKLWFGVAAVAYLTGAIVFEALGGARVDAVGTDFDAVYAFLYTAEESLEMLGLVVFMYALLVLLGRQGVNVAFEDPTATDIAEPPVVGEEAVRP